MIDLSLLPAADASVRCSEFARSISADPGGTGLRADLLIAVETPLPWPKPVFAHDLLQPIPALVKASDTPIRVLASVPISDDSLDVVAFRRQPGGATRSAWRTNAEHLSETVGAIVHDEAPRHAELLPDQPASEVWICTQGGHDVCCGADGARLAGDVDGRWDDVVVRRVSHTGGHRFAPTAMTLPDGRMWANLGPTELEEILTRTTDPSQLAALCRGWWGADQGPAQVAECGLLSATGWDWELAPRTAEVVAEDGGITTVHLTAGENGIARWVATVRRGREVPQVMCREPGGLPLKPGIEYKLIDIVAV